MTTYAPATHELDLKPPVAYVTTFRPNQTETVAMNRREQIRRIEIGQTVYVLRKPLHAEYNPFTSEYTAYGLPYVGTGQIAQVAREDWEKAFHIRFQEQYARLPFERTESEANEWRAIQTIVDLNDYANRTPVALRMIGQIIKKHPRFRVRWLDGRNSTFDSADAPPELAGFPLGKWFEAIGKYDPRNGKLIRLETALPIMSPPPAGSFEVTDFLHSLGGASDLPDDAI